MKTDEIHIRDPFILADKGKYYLYGTRGSECTGAGTGLDVYISSDLENWSDPAVVFRKAPGFWGTDDFWAPEVHKYNGKYYMFVSFKAQDRCRATHILVSDTPDGMFEPLTEKPVTPENMECLDGTLYLSKKGEPYIVFCHEWTQVEDGEICALKLSPDLKESIGEPMILFKGSSPSWSRSFKDNNYVTDGPFLFRKSEDELYMIWSTLKGDYVEAVAKSDNGEIDGNWIHSSDFLFDRDGGHGMIFRDFDGNLKFIMHFPNETPSERPVIYDIGFNRDGLTLK